MYICLCNGLTDSQIAKAIAEGAARPREVYASCGCGAQCGRCTAAILGMVREGQAAAGGCCAAGG